MSTIQKYCMLFAAILVIVGAGWGTKSLLGNKVSSDPKQMFHDALNANLTQKGVTCTVRRKDDQGTQDLVVQLDLASKTNARSVMTIKTATGTVVTEELALKSGNFLRYTKVDSSAKNAQGKSADFSKLINKWIRVDDKKQQSQLFVQSALGGCVVPLANVPTAAMIDPQRILARDKIFVTNFSKTKIEKLDGKKVRVYEVDVQPQEYVSFMQTIAAAYGLNNLKDVNAKDYAGKIPRKTKFYISAESGRLVKVAFIDEDRVVTFSDYGKKPSLEKPAKTISDDEANSLVSK